MSKRKYRYEVWPDSESTVSVYKKFVELDDACEFASKFVHKYDGPTADRVILHIEDLEADETIDTYENINKCDSVIWDTFGN
jgi:hypothetical protein